MKKIR